MNYPELELFVVNSPWLLYTILNILFLSLSLDFYPHRCKRFQILFIGQIKQTKISIDLILTENIIFKVDTVNEPACSVFRTNDLKMCVVLTFHHMVLNVNATFFIYPYS